jgi:hypothetical protein
MALTSWSDPMPPGRYHVEIKAVEEKKSQKGDLMWKVRLNTIAGFDSIDDVIMHEGAGLKMGIAKLTKLGVRKEMLPLNSEAIIGRRCYINVTHQTYPGRNGEELTRPQVNGMYEEDTEQPPMKTSDEIPF